MARPQQIITNSKIINFSQSFFSSFYSVFITFTVCLFFYLYSCTGNLTLGILTFYLVSSDYGFLVRWPFYLAKSTHFSIASFIPFKAGG